MSSGFSVASGRKVGTSQCSLLFLFPEAAFCHIRDARHSLYFPPLRLKFLLASFSVCGLQLEGGTVSCQEHGLDWEERRGTQEDRNRVGAILQVFLNNPLTDCGWAGKD